MKKKIEIKTRIKKEDMERKTENEKRKIESTRTEGKVGEEPTITLHN